MKKTRLVIMIHQPAPMIYGNVKLVESGFVLFIGMTPTLDIVLNVLHVNENEWRKS